MAFRIKVLVLCLDFPFFVANGSDNWRQGYLPAATHNTFKKITE